MDCHLLPLLSNGRWSNLTSLSLSWEGPGIKEETRPNIAYVTAESLAAVGSINSLEQLCLSAGEFCGWRHQWPVDHDEVRSRLRGLGKLKKLAFSRDTYRLPDDMFGRDVERYYENRWVTSAGRHDALERPHLNEDESDDGNSESADSRDGNGDDLGLANDKIWERAHRNRMLREVEQYAAIFANVATPLSKERDSSWTLLSRMFEMGE